MHFSEVYYVFSGLYSQYNWWILYRNENSLHIFFEKETSM